MSSYQCLHAVHSYTHLQTHHVHLSVNTRENMQETKGVGEHCAMAGQEDAVNKLSRTAIIVIILEGQQ